MRRLTLAAIIREDNRTCLYTYAFRNCDGKSDEECVEELRKVAKDWLSEHGDELSRGEYRDFNWGDLWEKVDDDFLYRYGITQYAGDPDDSPYPVDHDEILSWQ